MNTLTGESQIVSKAMMAQAALDTPNSHFWDGFFSYCEGQQLDEMPTPEHTRGWWAALDSQVDTQEYADDVADRDFWRKGC